MIHKLSKPSDVDNLVDIDTHTRNALLRYTKILSDEYGENRNVDNDYGGYVLYIPVGTPIAELKEFFDYSAHYPEFIERIKESIPPMCIAVYITSTEYGVVIIMSENDMPCEMKEYIDELKN